MYLGDVEGDSLWPSPLITPDGYALVHCAEERNALSLFVLVHCKSVSLRLKEEAPVWSC